MRTPKAPADDRRRSDSSRPPRRRRGRAAARLVMLLVLGGIPAAPYVIARVPRLRDGAAAWLLPPMDGEIAVGSASLGWLSPVVVRDATLRDREGRCVVRVPELRSDRTLADLLLEPGRLGAWECRQPRVTLAWEADGFTIERVLAPALAERRPDHPGADFTLSVVEGTVELALANEVLPVIATAAVELHIDRAAGTWSLREVSADCQSEFLNLSLRGEPARGTGRARADLDALAERLSQFVVLPGVELAGAVELSGEWDWPSSGPLRAAFQGAAERLAIVRPGGRAWREERLTVAGRLEGETGADGARRFRAGSLRLASGEDRLELTLPDDLRPDAARPVWPMHARLRGDVATWLARLPAGALPAEAALTGNIAAEGWLDLGNDSCAFRGLRADVEDFGLHVGDWRCEEPLVRLEGEGAWSGSARTLEVRAATLTSRAVAARLSDLRLQGRSAAPATAATEPANGAGSSGEAAFQIDLSRAATWLPRENRSGRAEDDGGALISTLARLCPTAGLARGRVQLAQTGDGTRFEMDVTSDDARWPADGAVNVAAERTGPLALSAAGSLDVAQDRLQLDSCRVHLDETQVDVAGSLHDLGGERIVALTGRVSYDLARWQDELRRRVGPEATIAGRQTHEFALQGPLTASGGGVPARPVSTGAAEGARRVSDALAGRGGLGWSQARVFGLEIGAGELDLRLAHGELRAAPIELAVGEGTLRLAPRLPLNAEPLAVVLDRGALANRMHLTPALCAGWLKYVAPLLAETTEADGLFSVTLEGASLPIDLPASSRAAGTLAIHSAQVRPGGLAQQLVQVARQLEAIVRRRPPRGPGGRDEPLLEFPAQEVAFRLADRRVQHEQVELRSGDVTFRTSGSVGLDETLDLVADVPIPADWVSRERYLQGLKGQSLRIPIRGTLRRPQLDARALTDLARRLAGTAAGAAVEDLLQQQLRRLLPK